MGKRSTERGRDKNLQLLRVLEKIVTSKKMQYSTTRTKMWNPSSRKNWNARQRKYGHNMREHSPVIAAELQIVDRGKKARSSLKQDGLVAQSNEGCRFKILSHH